MKIGLLKTVSFSKWDDRRPTWKSGGKGKRPRSSCLCLCTVLIESSTDFRGEKNRSMLSSLLTPQQFTIFSTTHWPFFLAFDDKTSCNLDHVTLDKVNQV